MPKDCIAPFQAVGGKCIFIDIFTFGTWRECRNVCLSLGGDLAKVETGNFFSDIIVYMHENGWADLNYWLGATDKVQEGVWRWVDESIVQMGTPFWANYGRDNYQEPTGGEEQNCLILDPSKHLYFCDASCNYENGHAICEA
ncbi:C-type lectin domain family 4 member D-like [Panulirus ornatus]|uniref:C-type lectin domain family 4 member D-like n=1 Tax=Panulirus ornatus TaxID=150431 RepID=UPI003A8B4F5C